MPSMMRIILCVVLAFSSIWPEASAQHIELTGHKVVLPENNVLSVGFFEAKDTLFVQQLVLSKGESGRALQSSRLVSSWNYKSLVMSSKRSLNANLPGSDAYACERLGVSLRIGKVLLCNAEGYLEILDPDTLKTVGMIGYKTDRHIYDFAIDDQAGRVFILALGGANRSLYLTSYSLTDGAQQQETVLPSAGGALMKLALVPKTGKVAVVLDHDVHGPQKSDVYACESKGVLSCRSVALIARVLQVDVLGDKLVGATDEPADRKKECLITVDLDTRVVSSREYCSPTTGVHYAVGVVDNSYVVGFTGTAKRVWWKEENLSEQSSFSVWAAENPDVIAIARDSANFGSDQFGASIFASRAAPLFVAHVGNSSELYIYTLIDSR